AYVIVLLTIYYCRLFFFFFFFFQAEDGIRDGHVTGVQTCALPILRRRAFLRDGAGRHGATPWHAAGLRPGGDRARRRAHGPDPAARGAGASGDLPPLDGGRDRRDRRPRRRRPPGEWDGSHGRPGRHATGAARFPE